MATRKLLRWLRTNKVSQAKLAGRIGKSAGHISKVLRSQANPSLTMIAEIEKITKGEVPVGDWHGHAERVAKKLRTK